MRPNTGFVLLLGIMILAAASCVPTKPKAPTLQLLSIDQLSLLAATPSANWYDVAFKLGYFFREAKTVSGRYRSIYESRFVVKGLPATNVILSAYDEAGKLQFDYFALAAISPGYFHHLKTQAKSAGFTLVEEDEESYIMVRKDGLKFSMKKQWEQDKEFYFVSFFY